MKAKIKEALSFWNRKLLKNDRAIDSITEEKSKKPPLQENLIEGADSEKFQKAISYFKQRHGNGSRAACDARVSHGMPATEAKPEQDIHEYRSHTDESTRPIPDILSEQLSANRPEVPSREAVQYLPETFPHTPIQEASDDARRKKPGWISPVYSQCRIVQLNPAYIAENRCLAFLENAPGAESYRILRTQILQQTRASGMNTIMVTSAVPREGKTLTAINLAFSLAKEFQNTVLLVDADLKKQSIHKYLGYESDKGLMNYLTERTPVSELITWPGIEKMTIISGGRTIQDCAELLGSPGMKDLVAELKSRYPDRYVIFDAPSILAGADALTLAPLVDRVIFVVQAGKTPLDDVTKAVQLLPNEKMLGFVMNRFKT